MNFWEILGISPTTDLAAIRHAYAEKTRTCHPEEDPEGFDKLHTAFQEATQYARRSRRSAPAVPKPEKRPAAGLPTGGAPCAVHILVFAYRQVVVYDIINIGHVETARCQVGSHEHAGRAVRELEHGVLALLLVHSAVKRAYHKSLFRQEPAYTLNAVAIVQEYDCALIAETAQQGEQRVELVLIRTLDHIQVYTT